MKKIRKLVLGVLMLSIFWLPVQAQTNFNGDQLFNLLSDNVELTFDRLEAGIAAEGQGTINAALGTNTTSLATAWNALDATNSGALGTWWTARVEAFNRYVNAVLAEDVEAQATSIQTIADSNQTGANLLGGIISQDLVSDVVAQLTLMSGEYTYGLDLLMAGELFLVEERKGEAKLLMASFLQILDDEIRAQIQAEAQAAADAIAAEIAAQAAAEAEAAALAAAEAAAQAAAQAAVAGEEPPPVSEVETVEATPFIAPTLNFNTVAPQPATTAESDTNNATGGTSVASGSDAVLPTTVFPFPDVNASHDFASIEDIKNRGIIQGYEDGTYRPEALINRAEFTKIVIEAALPEWGGGECFPDVLDQWFAPYVCTAADRNIVGGYPDGTFKPADNVNLAEAYKIIGETLFPGEAEATDIWFEAYVNLGRERGFYLGEVFPVETQVTREQMATIISRALASLEQ